MTFKQLPHLELNKYSATQQDTLLSFLDKVFELSCKCQYNTLYNANIFLPDLVGTYFDNDFVSQMYDELITNPKDD